MKEVGRRRRGAKVFNGCRGCVGWSAVQAKGRRLTYFPHRRELRARRAKKTRVASPIFITAPAFNLNISTVGSGTGSQIAMDTIQRLKTQANPRDAIPAKPGAAIADPVP